MRIRNPKRRSKQRVRVGAPDPSLTPNGGIVAVADLADRLGLAGAIDAAVGPIKQRARGHGLGGVLVGLAAAQLAGQDFLVGLDRVRTDQAGQQLTPVPGLATSTACGLARRVTAEQWARVETAVAAVHQRMWDLLPGPRRERLCTGATIDIDATDVEVYGSKKRGVAYNYAGQRCGRPDVATWAETETVLAADLLAGDQDPRSSVVALLGRAVAALPAAVRAGGQVRLRCDAGYMAGDLARAARTEQVRFAIGAKRMAPLWRLLDGIAEPSWSDAEDMHAAQVAVADYAPADWPAGTRLLIRRVRLDEDQVSADPRSRRRRTLHPDQRALPIADLTDVAVYAYSFICTDLDITTAARAVSVEHWYRHRTSVENMFRDSKHGAGLCHLPSGYPEINRAWMWAGLFAVSIAGWLHQLTATIGRDGQLSGWGVRDGKAMIATLRRRIITVPARLVHHAGQLVLRPAPGGGLLVEVLARIRALPNLP